MFFSPAFVSLWSHYAAIFTCRCCHRWVEELLAGDKGPVTTSPPSDPSSPPPGVAERSRVQGGAALVFGFFSSVSAAAAKLMSEMSLGALAFSRGSLLSVPVYLRRSLRSVTLPHPTFPVTHCANKAGDSSIYQG